MSIVKRNKYPISTISNFTAYLLFKSNSKAKTLLLPVSRVLRKPPFIAQMVPWLESEQYKAPATQSYTNPEFYIQMFTLIYLISKS